ncbi:MAG: hypothetical protein JWM76_3903 [Pseudonocardiales bacterium]|jgi:uncharacterized repeat protein (TIGR03847 family)|nr:hypothetical protein [Pseudonocardiales bacterium]
MPRQLHYFDRPQRFVAGTVGQPGDRTFFLQAIDGNRVVSVSLEKQQVLVLAERLEQMLSQIAERTGAPVPPAAPADTGSLSQPIEEEFRVAALGLAWDADTGQVLIEAQAPAEDAETAEATLLEDVDEGPDALRVRIGPDQALAFAERARLVISAGRPPCPLCTLPLDPQGHICPRQNGYRRGASFGEA